MNPFGQPQQPPYGPRHGGGPPLQPELGGPPLLMPYQQQLQFRPPPTRPPLGTYPPQVQPLPFGRGGPGLMPLPQRPFYLPNQSTHMLPHGGTLFTPGIRPPPGSMPVQPPQQETMTTVFVGGLPEALDDEFLERLLKVCGPLRRWRRVRDTQGAPKAFGFCEYQTADAVLRALRVLGGGDDSSQALELPDPTAKGLTRRLVVKADDATRSSLDEYEKARPKTEADVEQDKAARAEALDVIATVRGGKEVNESRNQQIVDNFARAPLSRPLEDLPENLPDRDVISKEIMVFRERAAERERQKQLVEQERLRRMQAPSLHQHGGDRQDGHHNDHHDPHDPHDHHNHREHFGKDRRGAHPSNGTLRTGGETETDKPSARSGSRTSMSQAAAEKAADEFLQRAERRMAVPTFDPEAEKRRLQKLFEEREARWEERENSHARSRERAQMQKREMKEKRERDREAMTRRLAEWDDDFEERRTEEEFYQDRVRWWNGRSSFHLRELEMDKRDREREEFELEKAAAASSGVDGHTGERLHSGTDGKTSKFTISFGGLASALHGQKRRAPIAGVGAGEESESDDEERSRRKKRALVPLDYGDLARLEDDEFAGLSPDEKRKRNITRLVSNIPTEKEGLWRWEIKWGVVDEKLLEGKVRPFVDKKMHELLGEEMADDLVDFVVDHVKAQADPEQLVKELTEAMLEPDEAEVFVVKLWRLIIYETESKAARL